MRHVPVLEVCCPLRAGERSCILGQGCCRLPEGLVALVVLPAGKGTTAAQGLQAGTNLLVQKLLAGAYRQELCYF